MWHDQGGHNCHSGFRVKVLRFTCHCKVVNILETLCPRSCLGRTTNTPHPTSHTLNPYPKTTNLIPSTHSQKPKPRTRNPARSTPKAASTRRVGARTERCGLSKLSFDCHCYVRLSVRGCHFEVRLSLLEDVTILSKLFRRSFYTKSSHKGAFGLKGL